MSLPDPIFRIDEEERDERAWVGEDCAVLRDDDRERFFVRALLELPIEGEEGYFGYGSWIEVSRERLRGPRRALARRGRLAERARSPARSPTSCTRTRSRRACRCSIRLRDVQLLPHVELDETRPRARAGAAERDLAAPRAPARRDRLLVAFDRPERVPLAERAGIEACVVAPGEVELVQHGAGRDAGAAVDDEPGCLDAGPPAAATGRGRSGSAPPESGRRRGRSARPRRASAPARGRRRASATRRRAGRGAPAASAVSSERGARREDPRLDLLARRARAARARRRTGSRRPRRGRSGGAATRAAPPSRCRRRSRRRAFPARFRPPRPRPRMPPPSGAGGGRRRRHR